MALGTLPAWGPMLRRVADVVLVAASLASCIDDSPPSSTASGGDGGAGSNARGGQQSGGVGAANTGGSSTSGDSGSGGMSEGGAGSATGGSAGALALGGGGNAGTDGGGGGAGVAGDGFTGTAAGGAGAVGGGGDPGARKRIFVTAGAFPGNFYRSAGGLEAGDAQCALSAATLGGVWRAWLSSSSVDAIDRMEDVGPWYLVDRTTLVFSNAAQLATGPSSAIVMSEGGERLAGKSVWTGTASQGTSASDTCSDWSSDRAAVDGQVGRSDATGPTWTSSTVETCGLYAGLYCIEQ